MTAINPFRIEIQQQDLDDLKQRLALTRWPEKETPVDWSQGLPLEYHREFCDYWSNEYDWYKTQERLNRFPQFKTTLDDLDIHFIHARSKYEDAHPIIITHGWPGSVIEFHKVIEPLTDPEKHGGQPEDAFHVVCPSLPGYGFSGKPASTGWDINKIADVWDRLMQRLGYKRYFAQGGDWGSVITTAIGLQNKGNCAAIHVNMPITSPTEAAVANPDEKDQRALAGAEFYQQWDSGYSKQQSTRPQTLGYALADSPSGQAAWILEKFYAWTDCDGHPENVLTLDELLDNIMLYWLTNSGASSARLYWESFEKLFNDEGESIVRMPAGCSIFPGEVIPTPRSWAELRYGNIQYWNELDKGGHFAAFEQPELFVNEVRQCFREIG